MRLYVRAVFAALIALLVAVGAAYAAAPAFPPLTGRVVDRAGILAPETQNKLTALLAEHEKQTGNQVVVVTLKSLDGQEIDQYGYQLGRAWGIGQKGKNNGALIIVSTNPHRARIEVGYGLEGALTDAQSKLIIENAMIPAFKSGDYDTGILNGTVMVLRTLGGKPSGAENVPQLSDRQQTGDSPGGLPIIIILILFLVFGRGFWPLLLLGGIGGGRGGGFGGGGFGGGGGGFSGGGGSFGGGGASGSW